MTLLDTTLSANQNDVTTDPVSVKGADDLNLEVDTDGSSTDIDLIMEVKLHGDSSWQFYDERDSHDYSQYTNNGRVWPFDVSAIAYQVRFRLNEDSGNETAVTLRQNTNQHR